MYRKSTCAVERRRAQLFALLAEGKSEAEVLELTKYSVSGARLILQRYHDLGLDGLRDGRANNPGAPRVLTAEEQQALTRQLQEDFEQGIVWDGKQVQAWVEREFGKQVHLARSYEFLQAAGFSLRKPRPRHIKGDPAAQDAFRTKS